MSTKVHITRHARSRMEERGISEGEVLLALSSPLEVIRGHHGRELFTRHDSVCRYIVAVVERAGEALIVITALRVDRERALRYGFTRV